MTVSELRVRLEEFEDDAEVLVCKDFSSMYVELDIVQKADNGEIMLKADL